MKKLIDMMFYLCVNYPYENELSNARLTKLVYLSDWFNSLVYGRQISNITWLFNHYGPYVDDVIQTAETNSIFKVDSEENYYGSAKKIIRIAVPNFQCKELNENERNTLNFVINKTKAMYFNEFIDYVYSTYPVSSNSRYTILNLTELAREYKSKL